jgi:hypothetical protein
MEMPLISMGKPLRFQSGYQWKSAPCSGEGRLRLSIGMDNEKKTPTSEGRRGT